MAEAQPLAHHTRANTPPPLFACRLPPFPRGTAMHYASSDSSDVPSQLRLVYLHELLLRIADHLQPMLRMTTPNEPFDHLIPPMEIKRAALAVAGYLRNAYSAIETVMRERGSPAAQAGAQDADEDGVAP
jgi:hypothetical protein